MLSSIMETMKVEKVKQNRIEESCFYSENFDSLEVLFSKQVVINKESSIKLYDNIEKFYSVFTGRNADNRKCETNRSCKKHLKKIESDEGEKSNMKKASKNVLTKMLSAKGPLYELQKCCKEYSRIRVWTRHYNNVRSICRGYLIAFDKHWNMVLIDVDEIFCRKKKIKEPAQGKEYVDINIDSKEIGMPSLQARTASSPKCQIIAKRKNHNVCIRHVNQLFIRGENVVLVHISRC